MADHKHNFSCPNLFSEMRSQHLCTIRSAYWQYSTGKRLTLSEHRVRLEGPRGDGCSSLSPGPLFTAPGTLSALTDTVCLRWLQCQPQVFKVNKFLFPVYSKASRIYINIRLSISLSIMVSKEVFTFPVGQTLVTLYSCHRLRVHL